MLAIAALIASMLTFVPRPASATNVTYVVDSTGVQPDVSASDSLCRTSVNTCTLRAALAQDAVDAVASRIEFNIPGSGPHQILLTAGSYVLADPNGGTVIDGYSEPGATPNTDPLASNAIIKIEVVGSGSRGLNALEISTPNNVVRGLAVRNAKAGIKLIGPAATGNQILGNFIGTNPAGTASQSVFNNLAIGVMLVGGASNNVIGSPVLADRNVVAGNAGRGIATFDFDTNDNRIRNNLVGVAPSGATKLPNLGHGIDLNTGSKRNIVGGYGATDRNVISGNGGSGGETSHGTQTRDNQWIGNLFGTDVTGNNAPTWARNGQVNFSNEDKVVNTLLVGNVFANNLLGGVKIHKETTGTRVENNLIGVTLNGTPSGNGTYGVQAELDVSDITIGPGNTIANNTTGVRVIGSLTQRIRITGNSIHANAGLGIDIAPLGSINQNDVGDGDVGPNTMLNYPVLTSATNFSVTGTACAGCRVEVFEADSLTTDPALASSYGEGRTLLASAIALPDGTFTIPVAPSPNPRAATSTATDPDGNTSEFSRNIAVPVSSNVAPTATFASSCTDLACTFDGTGSTDADGTITTYTWNFGDGTPTTTGSTVNKTFTASGTYQVALTVTDNQGGTNTRTTPITVNTLRVADDSFSRVVSGGWGTAAPLGGAWTPRQTADANSLSTNGTRSLMTLAAGRTRGAFLEAISQRDIDITATVANQNTNTGFGAYVALNARKNATASYQARVRFAGGGQVLLSITRNDNTLGAEVTVPAITWTPGTPVEVRFRVTGANPTTLQAKVWPSGTPEPTTWLVQRSDSDASLQGNGSIGATSYLTTAQTAGTVVTVDNFRAILAQ